MKLYMISFCEALRNGLQPTPICVLLSRRFIHIISHMMSRKGQGEKFLSTGMDAIKLALRSPSEVIELYVQWCVIPVLIR